MLSLGPTPARLSRPGPPGGLEQGLASDRQVDVELTNKEGPRFCCSSSDRGGEKFEARSSDVFPGKASCCWRPRILHLREPGVRGLVGHVMDPAAVRSNVSELEASCAAAPGAECLRPRSPFGIIICIARARHFLGMPAKHPPARWMRSRSSSCCNYANRNQ